MSTTTVTATAPVSPLFPFERVSDVRAANAAAGRSYFSRATMRAFRSRVSEGVYTGPGGQYIVTSEQRDDFPRDYSVARVEPSGDVDYVDCYPTLASARAAARDLAGHDQRYVMQVQRDGVQWDLWSRRIGSHVVAGARPRHVPDGVRYSDLKDPRYAVTPAQWRRAMRRALPEGRTWLVRSGVHSADVRVWEIRGA